MASSALQKLLRNQSHSASKIFTNVRQSLHPLLNQIPQISTSPTDSASSSPDHPKTDHPNPKINSFSGHVYPTFSFEFFLNPNSPPSLFRPEPDEETDVDDSNVIRADSVKKKRKKKMNKHKLRKLRKRLRKKT
ncbi:hypothetical protein ACP275_11G133600 [Erythranthe tilingii]